MPVEHLSARRPPTECSDCATAERPMGEVCGFDVDCERVVTTTPAAPPLPSGWEREDDYEDGRHRYRTEPTDAMFDSIHVAWWPTSGSVVISGWLCATEPLDALLAYLRALTPEQVTAQPPRSGASS